MATDIPTNTVVQVTNLSSTTTYKFQWESTTWNIKPGQTVIAPYYGMCNWFGNPQTVNVGDSDANRETQHRTEEVKRLSVLYGTYAHPWSFPSPYIAYDHTDNRDITNVTYEQRDGLYWHPQIPWIEVQDIDGGRILTVLEDPDGDGVAGGIDPTLQAESASLKAALATMQQKLAQLEIQQARSDAQLAAQSAATPNPDFEGEVGLMVDGPIITPDMPSTGDGLPADDLEMETSPPRRPTIDNPSPPRPRPGTGPRPKRGR